MSGPRFTRRLVWQLAMVVAFVSLAFVGSSFLRQREEASTHRQVVEAQTRVHAETLQTVVGLRGLALRNYVADYSLWNDMATFVETNDRKWATTNIDASLATFKLSNAWVFDVEGSLRYDAAVGERVQQLPGSAGGVARLFAEHALVHYFVRIADGTLLEVRGARIQREDDTERTSKALGYFFAALRWDAGYVDHFRALTGGEPTVIEAGAACAPPSSDATSIVVGQELLGRDARPVAQLCTRLPNRAAELLAASSRDAHLMSITFAVALFATLSALLHMLVARPLRLIRLGIAGDVSQLDRLQKRSNEFGELARAVIDLHRGVEERTQLRAQVYQAGKMASLGVLGAGMAHELNNPLTAVLGHADMLVAACDVGPLDAEEARESAAVILAQAERMRGIVDHVRLLSRAESGPPRLVVQDANAVVRDSILFLRSHVEHRGVAIELRLAVDLPPIACDRVMLESMVQNLVLNATDELETLEAGRPRNITVFTSVENRRVVLSVADDARGIPESARDRIFEPFFTTKPVGKGTGLGLALVHGMVGQHGGEVSFETSEAGTTFRVVFPPADEAPSAACVR